MERLFKGESVHTDGELTVSNLAREAGFRTRRPVYEAGDKPGDLVVEFQDRVQRLQAAKMPPADQRLLDVVRLKAELDESVRLATKYRKERDELALQKDSLANVILVLDAQLQALEKENTKLRSDAGHAASVTELRPRR
jgi:hypothetical protein